MKPTRNEPFKMKKLAVATGLGAMLMGGYAQAQMLEEVIVTAQKREQSLQDVGIAVTAFSGDTMQAMGIDSISKIQDMTPNLRIKSTITGVPQYSIRGVGENADTSALSSSPVAIHVNEVAQPYPLTASNLLFDLDRVEVLRGPQGDLFGLNSTGGTINYLTNKASEEFDASVMVEVGNYDRYKVEGYVNGALTDTISARLAVSQNSRNEGWQKNEITGEKLGEMEKTGARLAFSFAPSDTFTADLELHYSQEDSDNMGMRNVNNFFGLDPVPTLTDAEDPLIWSTPARRHNGTGWTSYTRGVELEEIGLPDTDLFAAGTKPYIDNEGYGGSLVMSWDLENLTVTSVTGYENFEREELSDSDGDEIQDSNQWFSSDLDLWSQELRVASAGDDKLSWMVGANVAADELEQLTMFVEPENFGFPGVGGQNPTQNRDIWAVFGHAEYQFTDKLTLITGLRYTSETREQEDVTTYKMGLPMDIVELLSGGVFMPDYNDPYARGTPLTDGDFSCFAVDLPCSPGVVLNDEVEFNEWSGKIGLNYFVNEDWMLYGSFSRGFKSGGFLDTAASSSASFVNSEAEFLNAYEVGAKGEFADGRVRLNTALFYYDYTDQQVNDFVVDPLFGPLGVIVNAPESEIYGGEIELIASPIDGLEIVQNIGYSKGTFEDFIGVDADASRDTINDPANDGFYSEVTIDRSGDDIEMPQLQYSGTIAYTASFNNGMSTRFVVDYSYEDEVETKRTWTDSLTGEQVNFGLPDYWLVNARASLYGSESWEVTLFADNLLDEEYLVDYTRFNEGVVQVVGMPTTYGLRLKYDF
ncbi:MAG: TonB-dependent receptor [Halioglobus sp.]